VSGEEENWPGGFIGDLGDLGTVSASDGLVVAAGGAKLHRIRPGTDGIQTRPYPFEDDGVLRVAVEPGCRRWVALSYRHIVVFDTSNTEGYMHLDFRAGDPEPWEIAWGKVNGESVMHMLDDTMEVSRPGPELAVLPLEHALKIASDRTGLLAILTGGDEEARLYVSGDGEQWLFRILDTIHDEQSVHLAIDGMSAAVSHDGELWVSRGKDDAFELIEDIEDAGAVAFDGAGALFVATGEEGRAAIARIDVAGNAERIAEIEPNIAELAWDASRDTLWAATSGGLWHARARKPRSLS
jgi:hypothetical protein